jgi:bacterioferritin-associated ferredoxin
MYVCICNGVTERAVREAAAEGVRTLADLTRRTGCASTCGGCAEYAEEVLRHEHARVAFPLPLLVAA